MSHFRGAKNLVVAQSTRLGVSTFTPILVLKAWRVPGGCRSAVYVGNLKKLLLISEKEYHNRINELVSKIEGKQTKSKVSFSLLMRLSHHRL